MTNLFLQSGCRKRTDEKIFICSMNEGESHPAPFVRGHSYTHKSMSVFSRNLRAEQLPNLTNEKLVSFRS